MSEPILTLRQVHKAFPGRGAVLDGVDLEVRPGERLAVTGPSGSGKTTLLHLAAGLARPDAGSIVLGGRPLESLDDDGRAEARRETLGMVFQWPRLLPHANVLENCLVPFLATRNRVSSEEVERARSLLAQVGLEGFADRRPTNLSGGEAQRVSLVRALVTGPALLLADEPTGALDVDTAAELLELLETLSEAHGLAVILVTHASAVAARAQSVWSLARGQLERVR